MGTELSDDQVREGHDDLEFMRRPRLWPNQTIQDGVLPLKRYRRQPIDGHGNVHVERDYATLIHYAGHNAYVFIPQPMTKLVMSDLAGHDYVTGQDELLKLLVDAGWVVD